MTTATERWALRTGSPTAADERSVAAWPASVQVLPSCFEWACDRSAGRVAVEVGGARLTYAELDRRANRLAHLLRKRGAIVRLGTEVYLTVPAVEEPEVLAARSTAGARIIFQDHLVSVSVVGTGLGRRPDVTARALLTLENEGIEPLLVTSAPNRVSLHAQTRDVHRAGRLLHAAFGLHRDLAAERGAG